jgi:hypothetical protein
MVVCECHELIAIAQRIKIRISGYPPDHGFKNRPVILQPIAKNEQR